MIIETNVQVNFNEKQSSTFYSKNTSKYGLDLSRYHGPFMSNNFNSNADKQVYLVTVSKFKAGTKN